MIRKRNNFFTLIFSMMFGAGQMYMGFMKQGLSIMSATTVIIFFGSWLNMESIILALPVLWFYSFFDAINKMSMPEENFKEQEDHFLFVQNRDNLQISKILTKYNTIIAALLILVGISVLGENLLDYLSDLFTDEYYPVINNFIDFMRWNAPRILFAIIIIVIGVKMILGKKKELDSQELQLQVSSIHSKPQSSNNLSIVKENETNENA